MTIVEPSKTNDRGYALIAAMIAMLGAAAVVVGIGSRVISQAHHTEIFRSLKDCLHGAEYAAALARAELDAGEDGVIGVEGAISSLREVPPFGDPRVKPIPLPGMPNTMGFAAVVSGPSNANGEFVTVLAFAQHGAFARGIEIVLRKPSPSSAWEQVSWREVSTPARPPTGNP